MFKVGTLAVAVCLALAGTVAASGTSSPRDAAVYFIGLADGDTVTSPITIRFGLTGMGIAPAGVEASSTGHHHLLINVDEIDLAYPVPSDENHRHFGGGQTEATIELAPGTHTLQLLLGDHNHIPHTPPVMSEKITITVN